MIQNNKKELFTRITTSVCITILIFSVLSCVFTAKGENVIYDKVVRLHVLANSDNEEDQALKLKVRDGIVSLTSRLFADCRDIESAKKAAEENSELLRLEAQRLIDENGFDYTASVETDVETYPVRRYSDFTFPAGDYFSVRIKLGKAEGRNWWCVLFPPLCASESLGESTAADSEILSCSGFSDEEIRFLTESRSKSDYPGEGTEVRFRIVDEIKKLFE